MRRRGTTARTGATLMLGLTLGLALGGCSGGPSQEERDEFTEFALERQAEYPPAFPPSVPTSIKEYVLGGEGIVKADYIVAGSFTGGRVVAAPADSADPSEFTLIGEFRLHQSLRGTVPSTFDVNLGVANGSFLASRAARGVGDVVLFLSYDASDGGWVLVDGKWAVAHSDGGDLSMPLVPRSEESSYLSGVIDVADIQALIIAGNLDPNGSLTGGLDDLGNDGISDTQQDLIDRANDLDD